VIERNRLRMYKEEESERARLMEDIIRLYERMKSMDGNNTEVEKKINSIQEKVAKVRMLTRPISPSNDYGDQLSIVTPGRRNS
jgi:adenylate cyclase